MLLTRRKKCDAMAVNQDRNMAQETTARYVPWHTRGRGEGNGLVGTLSVDALATGDATGGTVAINLRMTREVFGFPMLFVPTIINTKDNLAAAEEVLFIYTPEGNGRLLSRLEEGVLALDAGGVNTAIMTNTSVPIEGVGSEANLDVFSVVWNTNTNSLAYHLHMFGPVYDLQVIAKLGILDQLAAGLR